MLPKSLDGPTCCPETTARNAPEGSGPGTPTFAVLGD